MTPRLKSQEAFQRMAPPNNYFSCCSNDICHRSTYGSCCYWRFNETLPPSFTSLWGFFPLTLGCSYIWLYPASEGSNSMTVLSLKKALEGLTSPHFCTLGSPVRSQMLPDIPHGEATWEAGGERKALGLRGKRKAPLSIIPAKPILADTPPRHQACEQGHRECSSISHHLTAATWKTPSETAERPPRWIRQPTEWWEIIKWLLLLEAIRSWDGCYLAIDNWKRGKRGKRMLTM